MVLVVLVCVGLWCGGFSAGEGGGGGEMTWDVSRGWLDRRVLGGVEEMDGTVVMMMGSWWFWWDGGVWC